MPESNKTETGEAIHRLYRITGRNDERIAGPIRRHIIDYEEKFLYAIKEMDIAGMTHAEQRLTKWKTLQAARAYDLARHAMAFRILQFVDPDASKDERVSLQEAWKMTVKKDDILFESAGQLHTQLSRDPDLYLNRLAPRQRLIMGARIFFSDILKKRYGVDRKNDQLTESN